MTPEQIGALGALGSWAGQLGAGATMLLVLALVGVQKGWWVPGSWHRERLGESRAETAFWRERALRHMDTIEKTIGVAEKLAG